MAVECMEEYLTADIRVNLEKCKGKDRKHLRLICYHEMVHVLMSELSSLARNRCVTLDQLRDSEEKLAQIIAGIAAS